MKTATDRDKVNAHIEACGTGIRSGHTPVSTEFADEMLGAVPPEYMGVRMCFEYFQVGEISQHMKGVPHYETYTIVRKSARNKDGDKSEWASAYDEDQWYFIGLKPSMADTK